MSNLMGNDPAMELRTKRAAFSFFLRQASPQIVMLASVAFLTARMVLGNWRAADAFMVVVIPFSWHIQERLLHEYVLHLRSRRFLSWALLKRLSAHHRRHHLDPWRTKTLFIATSAYFFNVPAVLILLLAITRDIRLTLSGSFAYFFTLVCFEWVHLLIHTPYVPQTHWYRRRWWNHRLHHFRDSRYWFGITSPMWDAVLGSRPDPRTIQTRKNWRGPKPLT
jgi:hypothetical protein